MRKRNIPIILGTFLLATGVFFSLALALSHKKIESPADLINISKLSEEFMEDYFENMKQISANYDSNSILIVVASKEPKENFGAKTIVKAPNNTYILAYEKETDKLSGKNNLKNADYVYSVKENQKYAFDEVDNNSAYNSWGIEKSGLSHALNLINEKGGENVTAAIIDTGCDLDLFNASYSGKIEETYNIYEANIYGNDVMFDNYGHGTHIAGTIAEGTPDNVKILPIKVSDGEFLSDTDIITAINYITYNHKADVINMSFGGPLNYSDYSTDPEYLAIEAAKMENIISVVAAGNESSDALKRYPAAFDNTISISAVDSNKYLAEFSNYGDAITFAAPGVDILSINGTSSGTSMATPHAVAAVSIIKSINKNLSLSAITEILAEHTDDLGPKGKDSYFGYGFINLSDVNICEDPSIQSCDNYAVFRKINPADIAVEEVILTPYNYGSITNILATKLRIISSDGAFEIKRLDELDEISISGYDPYSLAEQTISISYQGLETSFTISNPNNYELGWEYQDYYTQDTGNSLLSIIGYRDSNLQIKKLYLPSTIDNRTIYTLQWGANEPHVFGNSNDAKYYQEVYLPNTIRKLGADIFTGFDNLYLVKSDAEDLEISSGTFMSLRYLSEVHANILFGEYSSSAFSQDELLKAITLSSKNTLIPPSAFSSCKSLKNIELPSSITQIGEWSFSYSGLESIVLPNNLQQIGHQAFAGTRIQSVFIPSSVIKIGAGAFGGKYLETISVSEGNTIYDSRNDSNAIIESSTGVLVVGSNQTVIPDSVKAIGDYAFAQSTFPKITIPDGVVSIGEYAFFLNDYLDKVIIPASVTSIGENNFETTGYYTESRTKIYTYSGAYAHNYAIDIDATYVLLDETPSTPDIEYIVTWFSKINYLPYEQADLEQYKDVEIKYVGIDELEQSITIDRVIYPENRDSFRNGDRQFYIVFNTGSGYHNLHISYPVEIGKLNPEYTIPTNIIGNINSTLSDIELPKGFEWENGETVLTETGNKVYKARYIPDDQDNYNIVEDIAIPVEIIGKALLKPTITIMDKIYDGTTALPFELIDISDIDTSTYSLEGAYYDTANAGSTTAHVVLKLSDETFANYSFANGLQEKTFNCNAKILYAYVDKPTMREMEYVYNGSEQVAVIDNYSNKKMTIQGNRQTNAGEYDIIISLINDNYLWEDGTKEPLIFKFTIQKAEIPNCLGYDTDVLYDGQSHQYELYCYQSTTKYMDQNGNYILDEPPAYTEPGEYIVKIKIYRTDNYQTIYMDGKITIHDSIDFAVHNYTIDDPNRFIKNIPSQTTEEEFKSYFETLYYMEYYTEVDTIEVDGEKLLYTGGKTRIYRLNYTCEYGMDCPGILCLEYTNIVTGDTDGNGLINSTDLLNLRKHLLTTELLEGPFYAAADTTNDDNINSADLLNIRRYLISGSME